MFNSHNSGKQQRELAESHALLHDLKNLKPISTHIIGLIAAPLVAIGAAKMLVTTAHPLRPLEYVPVVFLLCLPLALIVAKIIWTIFLQSLPSNLPVRANSVRDYSALANFFVSGRISGLITNPKSCKWFVGFFALYLTLLSSAFLTASTLKINEWADRSEAKAMTFLLSGKADGWHRPGKKNDRHPQAYFPSPVAQFLPFAFTNNESLKISRTTHDRITIGQSSISIKLHSGFFGIPWYEHDYTLNGLTPWQEDK